MFPTEHALSTLPLSFPSFDAKFVLTKQEDETFNASQMLRGMQNKCTAKHFQPFSFSTSPLYSKNKS